MRAITQQRYGPPDVLRLRETARPRPGDTEVLVRVAGAGVDRGVWHLMTGLPLPTRLVFGLRRPRSAVPGMDVSGVVEQVGSRVTRFAEGDQVFGIGNGTFAEYAVASQDKLAAVPAGLALVDAGALAVSGSTALQAVEDHGRVEAAQHVLVMGASGGVGSYAVQIARSLGAEVTGVASTQKVDLVQRLGAHHVVDHRAVDPLDVRDRYDVIIDTGGNRRLRDLRHALTPTGTLVIVGGEGGGRWLGGLDRQLRAKVLSLFSAQRLTTFMAAEDAAHLERLADLVEHGHLTPTIDTHVPLERTAEALRRLEAGAVRGKVVVDLRHGDQRPFSS
jgi:NADPH:quinone reductase-like Zn-dependent oxidoreductase